MIKIYRLGHETSQYYSKIFYLADTLPTALGTIWERDLNLLFSELEWNGICQKSKKVVEGYEGENHSTENPPSLLSDGI